MDHEFAGIKLESITKALDAIHSHADCEGHRGALVNALITLTAGVPDDHHLSVIVNCERRGDQVLRSILTFSSPEPITTADAVDLNDPAQREALGKRIDEMGYGSTAVTFTPTPTPDPDGL